jgi:hypothetical protein
MSHKMCAKLQEVVNWVILSVKYYINMGFSVITELLLKIEEMLKKISE